MQTFIDANLNKFQKDLVKLNEAADARDSKTVKALAEELIRKASRLGLRSAFLHWQLAVACDMLDETEKGLDEISVASALDPFDHNIERSLEIIVWKLRDSLQADAFAEDEAAVTRVYEKLSRIGCADVSSHLAMVRHLAVKESSEVALEFVNTILKLHPFSADAWRHKATIAESLGNQELVADCMAHVTALTGLSPAEEKKLS